MKKEKKGIIAEAVLPFILVVLGHAVPILVGLRFGVFDEPHPECAIGYLVLLLVSNTSYTRSENCDGESLSYRIALVIVNTACGVMLQALFWLGIGDLV